MLERAKKIQAIMWRAGYVNAAEEFLMRAFEYSRRDFEYIERFWLNRSYGSFSVRA